MKLIKRKVCLENLTSRKPSNWGVLDDGSIVFPILIDQTFDELGNTISNALTWIPGKRYYKGEYVLYDNRTYVLSVDTYVGEYDDEYEEIAFDTTPPTHWVDTSVASSWTCSNASATSKLKGLRRRKRPTNDNGTEMIPNKDSDEDWMILYLPNIYLNVKGEIEEFIKNGKRYNRMINATGDIINGEPIIDTINNTITYKYTLGENIKQGDGVFVKDDSRVDNSLHYTDVYGYVDGEFQPVTDYNNLNMDNLGVFHTLYSTTLNEYNIGYNNGYDNTIMSQVEFTDNNVENKAPAHRQDYMIGITYEPTVKKDIQVDRGINSAFERHLKLSEIKTLQDLENYSNGSFYSIKET